VDAVPRWLAYIATLLVVGASVFRFGILRSNASGGAGASTLMARRAATVALVAALALVLVAPLRLLLQARTFTDPGEPMTVDLVKSVLGSVWGRGWTIQLLAAGVAAAGALFARVAGAGWISAAVGAAAVVLATPLTGHAIGAVESGAWGYPLDAFHILGGGAWLGTLGVLLLAGVAPARREPEEIRGPMVAALVHAFHPVALYSSGVTMLAGFGLSIRFLGGELSGLWTSGWGKTLIFKLVLLGGVATLGAWNSRVMRPGLGTVHAARRFTRSALVELGLATALLAVTALLVVQPLPSE
jgi:putative copper export protein